MKVLQEAVTKMELDRHRFGGTTLVKNKGGKAENGEKLQTGMQASHHWGWRWGCGERRATGSKSLARPRRLWPAHWAALEPKSPIAGTLCLAGVGLVH